MAGLAFLAKKSWHTSNLSNQERVWLAEQKAAAEEKKTKELQDQIKLEREREEFQKLTNAGGKRGAAVATGDRGTNWMYEGGFAGASSATDAAAGSAAGNAAAAAEEAKNESYLLGKEYVPEGQKNHSGDFAVATEMTGALEKASTYGAAIGVGEAVLRIQDDVQADSAIKNDDDDDNNEWNQDFHLRHEDPMYAVHQKRMRQEKDAEKKRRLMERAGLEVRLIRKGKTELVMDPWPIEHGKEENRKRRRDEKKYRKKKKRKHSSKSHESSRKHSRGRRTHVCRSPSLSSYSSSSLSSHSSNGHRQKRASRRREAEACRESKRGESRERIISRRWGTDDDSYGDYDKHNSSGHNRCHRGRSGSKHDNGSHGESWSRSGSRIRGDNYQKDNHREFYHGRSGHNKRDEADSQATMTEGKDDARPTSKKSGGYGLIGTSLSDAKDQQPQGKHSYLGPSQQLLVTKRQEVERERKHRLDQGRRREERHRHSLGEVDMRSKEEREMAIREMERDARDRDQRFRGR